MWISFPGRPGNICFLIGSAPGGTHVCVSGKEGRWRKPLMERERKGKQGKKDKKSLCGLNQNPDFSDPIAKLYRDTDVELLRQVCVSVREQRVDHLYLMNILLLLWKMKPGGSEGVKRLRTWIQSWNLSFNFCIFNEQFQTFLQKDMQSIMNSHDASSCFSSSQLTWFGFLSIPNYALAL